MIISVPKTTSSISPLEELEHLNLCSDDPTERLEIAYRAVLEVLLELRKQVMIAYTQAGNEERPRQTEGSQCTHPRVIKVCHTQGL